jgi:predicted O-methyltransferase YrrM
MNDALDRLKAELEQFGALHDATVERAHRMFNITRDTGEFLSLLVRATAARHVLEIGTSNGYSTLWLADAIQDVGGAVTTVESASHKADMARANFERSGLSGITLVQEDAGHFMKQADPSAFDLLFLDSERSEYTNWWPDLRRMLRAGGLLVVDNATSHEHELAPLVGLVKSALEFTSCLVPVGKGEFLAVKRGRHHDSQQNDRCVVNIR